LPISQALDRFVQNDFHVRSSPGLTHVFRHEGQKREVTSAFDGLSQLALVTGRRPGDFAGHDLATLVHELAEQLLVLVVDMCDLVFGEVTGFALADFGLALAVLLAIAFTIPWRHYSSPSFLAFSSPLSPFSPFSSASGAPSATGAGGIPAGFSATVSQRKAFSLMRRRFSSSAGRPGSAS